MSLHVCPCECLQQWQTTSNNHKEWIGPVQLQFLRRRPSFIIQMSHGNESPTPAQSLRYQKAVEKDGPHEQKKPEHQCEAFLLAFPLLIPLEIGLNACAAFGTYFSWQNAQTALRTCRLVFPCKISSLSSCSMLFLLTQWPLEPQLSCHLTKPLFGAFLPHQGVDPPAVSPPAPKPHCASCIEVTRETTHGIPPVVVYLLDRKRPGANIQSGYDWEYDIE